MPQLAIPYVMMRGGTSRGAYFRRSDLPGDLDALAEILVACIGAGHPLNIDGIGGGAAVTTKVAILSPSDHPEADIDYFFAQVSVTERRVDFAPTCGNILSGVAAAAVELGLIQADRHETVARIRSVNTEALVEARIATPDGIPAYDGDEALDGVPGTASPVRLTFRSVEGSKTRALLPTGHAKEEIGGVEVTLIDAAMPMMILRAADVGLTGTETAEELADTAIFARLEPLRLEAGVRMGLYDTPEEVAQSVVPKVGLLAPHASDRTLNARYMMPQGDRWDPHPTFAVTGAICVTACVLAPGTVAEGMVRNLTSGETDLTIAHPSGTLRCVAEYGIAAGALSLKGAGLVRTARKLADGHVYVPALRKVAA